MGNKAERLTECQTQLDRAQLNLKDAESDVSRYTDSVEYWQGCVDDINKEEDE